MCNPTTLARIGEILEGLNHQVKRLDELARIQASLINLQDQRTDDLFEEIAILQVRLAGLQGLYWDAECRLEDITFFLPAEARRTIRRGGVRDVGGVDSLVAMQGRK